jgi:hypothetical protein
LRPSEDAKYPNAERGNGMEVHWTELYGDVAIFGSFCLALSIVLFLGQIIVGFFVVTWDFTLNYIIKQMGGLKGFAAWLASCFGWAALIAGATNLGLVVLVLIFFPLAEGKFPSLTPCSLK